MKNKISKILGVGLVLAILASMLVVTTPASAGVVGWTASTPVADGPATSSVSPYDIAVAPNGTTAYAVTGTAMTILKSTDGGSTWVPLASNLTTGLTGITSKITKVAVAPDITDGATIFIVADDNEVYVTENGGVTWAQMNAVSDVSNNSTAQSINSISVSTAAGTSRTIAVAGTSTANIAGVWYYTTGGGSWSGGITNIWVDAMKWSSSANYTNGTGYSALAVQFSPNYLSDRTMVVVTASASAVRLNMANLANMLWNGDYPVYGTTAWNGGVEMKVGVTAASITNATAATITLPSSYAAFDTTARVAYISVTAANAGLFRANNNLITTLSSAPMNSVAVTAAGDNLVAGGMDNTVYHAATPGTATVVLANATFKPAGFTGATNTVVVFLGSKIGAANRGAEGAFALSTDGGVSFNDVAFVRTVAAVKDMVINADGSKIYLSTYDEGSDVASLWVKTTSWQRVFKVASANEYIIRPALSSFDVIFFGEKNGKGLYYSNDGGLTTWIPRYSSQLITDMAAESQSIVYVLAGGSVYKATDGGAMFNISTLTGAGTGVSMKLLSEGNILVAGATGVAYSTDSAVTFTYLPLAFAGAKYAVADKLAAGGVIMATDGSAVKKFTIGTSTAFSGLYLPTTTAGYTIDSMVQNAGVTYAMSNNGTDSIMLRSAITATAWTSTASTAKLFGITASGADLLALNQEDNSIWRYTDIFAAAGPAMVGPAAGFINPINKETGNANNIVFQWTAIASSSATATYYNLQIALDADFKQVVDNILSINGVIAIVGPTATTTPVNLQFAFQSDTTYYWRVRVSDVVDSPWSKSASFKIATLSPVELVAPAIGVTGISINPTFAWSAAQGATGYVIELADSANFAIITYSHTTTQPVYAATDESDALDYATVYYWRVKPTGPSYPTASTPYVTGIFTTMAQPTVAPTTEPITITQTNPTYTISVPATTNVIPTYLLWIIIGIGAILVITLIVLIVRTRRVG